jgi:oxygen-independent coproporphyrinogen-3 oxidase
MLSPVSEPKLEPLSIYLHWPFCGSKCPYCDFNSHVRPQIEEQRWVDATISGLDYWHGRYPDRQITTIFWGGGTPSLLAPASVERVLSHIAKRWSMASECEITLEANPTTHEAERFQGFRAAGVNRLSLGVQSFQQDALDFLGRTYKVAEAEHALAHIAETFPRYSYDLIYALPGQTLETWRPQLDHALSFAGEHISLYQLTFEQGTRFYQLLKSGKMEALDDETAADLYDYTHDQLTTRGLLPYEVSNFAVPGQECRHNLTYWTGGDWIGVGPGAHGRIGQAGNRLATTEWRSPERWLQKVEANSQGCETETPLSAAEAAEELVLMGLRLSSGIDRYQFETLTGLPLDHVLAPDRVETLVKSGLADLQDDRIALTPEGRQVLDAAIKFLLID